ncbi:coiled-coil domain-containing protein 124, partial [Clonorchis sinensis]
NFHPVAFRGPPSSYFSMPKKLGTCPKAVEARERRAAKKKEEQLKKEREAEEAYWKEDDKHAIRKLQRKDERDDKRQEELDRKRELKRIYEEEMANAKNIKGASGKTTQANKLTQAQIAAARANLAAQLAALNKKNQEQSEQELAPNPNRVEVDGAEARTVEDAIAILNVDDDSTMDLDRHPERRLKAAYSAYEEKMLPILREENPGLRISQLKQLIFKKFQTAPENPKNQVHSSYNAGRPQ